MMKKYFKLYIGFALIATCISCAPNINEFEPQEGKQVDYTRYIAVGNSLTAGFADGGLYLEGQKVAFPNLIAEQLNWIGGAKDFNSPFFSEQQKNGSGYLYLKELNNGVPTLENVTDQTAYITPTADRLAKNIDKITNLGVPGMRLDLAFAEIFGVPVHGNMYFERLLKEEEEGKISYFTYSTSMKHTFFTFWLGNNDVLGYAMNGAVEEGPTSTLTDVNKFAHLLDMYITELTQDNQKGAIATIPDVTTVPFFTTVTRIALLKAVNQTSPAVEVKDIYILTKEGARAATDQDLFILPFSNMGLLGQINELGIPYGLHPANPVEDKYVLDKDEVIDVSSTVNSYNKLIHQIAKEKNLAVVDVHKFLNKVKMGVVIQDIPFSNEFITGNAFSLDGIHLTPMGNAVIANLFIESLNKQYGSQIPSIDVTKYSGVKFP